MIGQRTQSDGGAVSGTFRLPANCDSMSTREAATSGVLLLGARLIVLGIEELSL
jgi:hypothetical protein